MCGYVTDWYYEYLSQNVINTNGTTVTWDVSVTTDRTILGNRPDVSCTIKNRRLAY